MKIKSRLTKSGILGRFGNAFPTSVALWGGNIAVPKKVSSKEKEMLKQLAEMPNIKSSSKNEAKNFFKRFGL